MATPLSFLFLTTFLFAAVVATLTQTHQGRDAAQSRPLYVVQLSSLLPSTSCEASATTTTATEKQASLRVVHRHGPCARPGAAGFAAAEILQRDQSRVNFIHSRLSAGGQVLKKSGGTTLPAKSGITVGSGNYVVTVGIGTPAKQLSLMFDTGSDLTWTQCEPCVRHCYTQREPIFDPSRSTSYANVTCKSTLCNELIPATGNMPNCSGSTCIYAIQYGDSSFSVGFFSQDTLTLTPADKFEGFAFGCGEKNDGLFGGSAGLLGLGREKVSLVQQTATKYQNRFSYCLPSKSSLTGRLTFGHSAVSAAVKYTPMLSISEGQSFYGIGISGISVGGRRLPISASIFSNSGAIIDSGTVITRLPPTAYSALRDAFRQQMSKYPAAPALSILDTCYDLSKYRLVAIPKVSFFFKGEVEVPIHPSGIMYANSATQVCLAFAPNDYDSMVTIFGNVQQQTLEVVYDVAATKIGFVLNGCT